MESFFVLVLIVFCSSSLVSSREPLIIPATVVEGGEDTCPTEQQRQDTLREIRDQVQAALKADFGCPTDLGSLQSNPAGSCNEIYQCSPLSPSGSYWLRSSNGSAVEVYCDMNRTACCNSTGGGWARIAQFDMRDPTQNCPEGWRYIENPKRLCGRDTIGKGCESVTYSTYGMNYSRVCGRAMGYVSNTPDAFPSSEGIDGVYVDGLSVTHGSEPRQHVWTFAASYNNHCPCANDGAPTAPDFIGNDYFCEVGQRGSFVNPLWDGVECGPAGSRCCIFSMAPWFCKQLDQPTTDDIKVRLCGNEGYSNEDTPLELIELYVQ